MQKKSSSQTGLDKGVPWPACRLKHFMRSLLRFIWRPVIGVLALAVANDAAAQGSRLNINEDIFNATATVSHSAIDIGTISNSFDGSTTSLARSAAINPFVVTLTFASVRELTKSRVFFYAGNNRWRVETANTLSDLDSGTGSFRVALDWETGVENAWHERAFAEAVECRLVRLKLQVLSGNHVHLNEWELFGFAPPGPDSRFEISEMKKTGSEISLSWVSEPTGWYEVQSSTNLTQWTGSDLVRGAGPTTVYKENIPAGDQRFYRIRKAAPEERKTIVKKVLVLNFEPTLEAHGNKKLWEYLGWTDPRILMPAYLDGIAKASGNYIKWQVAGWQNLDHWPKMLDGFQYTDETYVRSWQNRQQFPFHTPEATDYEAMLDMPLSTMGNKTAHQLASSGEVDEVVIWGAPFWGGYESRMVGRTAYWCNSPPLIRDSRLYVVMGLNYERGVPEALHSFSHRCESIMLKVYGSWSGTSTVNHLWDRFTRVKGQGVAVAGCGNVHFPPNATADYDYGNPSLVLSEADSWLNFPDLSAPAKMIGRSDWGLPDYQSSFLIWWMSRFPKAPGRYVDPTNAINHGKLNNWWGYLVDMNEYKESR